ncbi:mitochondrial-processing peptidase subunit alpha-like [Dysidea avara]|uniref:mitochondrial-processing peptidase subunit alpha-like n=1 Tax=Dysidea avara TaxID=196820 RepID=UPI003318AB7B
MFSLKSTRRLRCAPLVGRWRSYLKEPLTEPVGALKDVQWSAKTSNVPRQYPTHISTLGNGLRVASQNAYGQFCTIGVFIDAGSRNELPHKPGITHLLSRVAIEKTEQFSDREKILEELEKYGGMIDCQTFRDTIAYGLSALSYSLPEVIQILAQAVYRPQFTEEQINMELQSVLFETEDAISRPDPEPILTEMIHQAAYRDNTFGLPRMLIDYCADDADITKGTGYEQITPGDIKQFIASHYTPDRMMLAGVGVDHEQFVELAEKYFVNPKTSWDSSDMIPVDGSISQYTGGHCKIKRLGPPVVGPNPMPELTHVVVAMESTSHQNLEDFFPVAVLNSLMGGGSSFSPGGPGKGMYTQLYTTVLNQHHWAYSAIARNHSYFDTGLFAIYGSSHPSHSRNLVEVLCQQFHHMASWHHPDDISRAKKQLESALMMNMESRVINFEDLGRQVLATGSRLTVEELCSRIDAVTAEDVQRVASAMLKGKPSLAVLGDLSQIPSMKEIEAAMTPANKGRLPRSRLLFPR